MKKLIFICALIMLTSSCATLFKGTTQMVYFESSPPQADVVAVQKDGTKTTLGKTPCTVSVHKKTREIEFVKSDYYDEKYPLYANKKAEGWYYVDCVGTVCGLIGLPSMIVDLATGAAYKLPNDVKVELKKKQ
jgi:hypothetical protein